MVVRLHRIATNHQELGAGLLGMARGVGTPFTPYSGLMPQRGAAMCVCSPGSPSRDHDNTSLACDRRAVEISSCLSRQSHLTDVVVAGSFALKEQLQNRI